jgi:hypothetical protein
MVTDHMDGGANHLLKFLRKQFPICFLEKIPSNLQIILSNRQNKKKNEKIFILLHFPFIFILFHRFGNANF